MITIKLLNQLDYWFLMGEFRTAYSDIQVHKSVSGGGDLLGLLIDGEPVGYLIAEATTKDCRRITHLFVRKDCRKRGLARMLIEQECRHATSVGTVTVSASIIETHPCFPVVKHLLEGLSFQVEAKVHVFSCERNDLQQWKQYMLETGNRLCSWLEDTGYQTIPLSLADSGLIAQLYHSAESEYGNTLNAKTFLNGAGAPLGRELSFLTGRAGKLMAYTMVSKPDNKNTVMEQISVSQQCENRGVILLPFSKTIEAFEAGGFERAAYAMYDTNLEFAEREKCGKPHDGLLENMNQYSSWIMKYLGVRGGCCLSSAACASGTTVAGMAFDYIRNGICDIAVVGGADPLTKVSGYGFHALKSLSSTVCNPYDRDRGGINIGEGSAFFLFEEMEAAQKRGAKIYGEIIGYGLNNDAYHVTSPDPEGKGAVASMRTAMEDGGVCRVDYINGHGTGTPINDRMEISANKQLFSDHRDIAVSSTKALIGHCMGASGSLELAAVLLAMENQVYMPMPKLQNVIEDGDSMLLSSEPTALAMDYAISNSFAFAGNTASILVSRFEKS